MTRVHILHVYNLQEELKFIPYHHFLFGILICLLCLIKNSSLRFKNIFLLASEKDLTEQRDTVSSVKKGGFFRRRLIEQG